MTRRELLATTAAAGTSALVASGCGGGPREGWVRAARVADLRREVWTPLALRFPFGRVEVFVRRDEGGGGARALLGRCTHLGCPVRYVDAAERFVCPCHGGVFDDAGRRVGGPPARSLRRLRTAVHEGAVYVEPRA